MPKATTTPGKVKQGASNAFSGIKEGTGTSHDIHGVSGSWKNDSPGSSHSTDSTVEATTVKSSTTINQHKRLAMTGHI